MIFLRLIRFFSYLILSKRFIYYKILLFSSILFTIFYVLSDKKFDKSLTKDNSNKILAKVSEFKALETNIESNENDINKEMTNHKQIPHQLYNTQVSAQSASDDNSPIIRFGDFRRDTMKIAITVCGNKTVNQSLITLKSAVILTDNRVHLIIMADEVNRHIISRRISKDWPKDVLNRISYEIRLISFPSAKDAEEWRKLFKPCAAQRLFLPAILRNIDSVLYVDTDVLFLTPLDQIWKFFSLMNNTQMAAMSSESEDFASSWYHRFAKHPYVQRLGVNSGVMLMNLTRMRTFGWTDLLEPYLSQYKLNIVWGDQDIINIIFHFNSGLLWSSDHNVLIGCQTDKLLKFDCSWNYRPDHCIYTRVCKEAERSGVRIIHGNRGVFLNEKQPSFRVIYQSFESYEFGSQLSLLLASIKSKLEKQSIAATNCGKARHTFTKAFEQFLNQTLDKSSNGLNYAKT